MADEGSAVASIDVVDSLVPVDVRWWSRRAMTIHLTALVVVPGCMVAFWWQLNRALGGNELSWAYVFEWPIFAVYGVYTWWRLIHEAPEDDAEAEVLPVVTVVPATTTTATSADIGGGFRRSEASEGASPVGDGPPGTRIERDESPEDPELAAYNRYLAELHAGGWRKHW